MIKQISIALCVALISSTSSFADEFEDIIEGALEAYRDGDSKIAKEEIEYALELLKNAEGKSLQAILPTPLDGWTQEFTDDAQAMTMLGGLGVSADYRNESSGDKFSITVASSPQIAGAFGAMFGSAAAMGAMGELTRIQREKFVISDNQIQGLVNDKFYVNFEGDNTEAMKAHLENMDIKALKEF